MTRSRWDDFEDGVLAVMLYTILGTMVLLLMGLIGFIIWDSFQTDPLATAIVLSIIGLFIFICLFVGAWNVHFGNQERIAKQLEREERAERRKKRESTNKTLPTEGK